MNLSKIIIESNIFINYDKVHGRLDEWKNAVRQANVSRMISEPAHMNIVYITDCYKIIERLLGTHPLSLNATFNKSSETRVIFHQTIDLTMYVAALFHVSTKGLEEMLRELKALDSSINGWGDAKEHMTKARLVKSIFDKYIKMDSSARMVFITLLSTDAIGAESSTVVGFITKFIGYIKSISMEEIAKIEEISSIWEL